MVTTRPLISKSLSPFTDALMTVPSTQVTTDITITFMFYYHFHYCYLLLESFSHLCLLMVFQGSLRYSKSPQVSKIPLSILANLNNAVIRTVSTRSMISKSSSPLTDPLVTVSRAPITIGIIVTFMFHSFFNSLAKSRYLSLFSHSFNFTWTAKSMILQVLSLLLIIIKSGCLAEIRWSVCMLKSQKSLCISFSRTDSGFCIYYLFIWSKFNFLYNSQSYQALYSFCANLLHSLIIWLIVSSLSLHNLYLLFCQVLSILTLIWWVLMALFCAAIRSDLVSLLKFPFFSHVHVFLCEMSLVSHLKCP